MVDGIALVNLTHGDLTAMLPGKVGAARKLSVLLDQKKRDLSGQVSGTVQLSYEQQSTSEQQPTTASLSKESIETISQIPLPEYSTRVSDALARGQVLLEFDMFIEETAYSILSHGDMTSKNDYEEYGKRLLLKYPCLNFPGKKHDWSFVTSKLSQKLRHIRWLRRIRSGRPQQSSSATCAQQVMHKKRKLCTVESHEKDLTEEQANVELHDELQKPLPDRDTPRIRRLFRQTFTLRRNVIMSMADGSVHDLVEKFPLLTDPAYIMIDFDTIFRGREFARTRYEQLILKLKVILELDDADEIDVLMKLEKHIAIRTPTSHLGPAICMLKESTEVTAPPKSPPRLVIGPAALQCRIVADRVIVDYDADDIFSAVMIVLACYFAWDLAYPRCYQILSFLHVHVLGESTNVRKSTNFVKVEKMLSSM